VRGLALWFIFIDHIPDNVFAWLTLRNYGFSDTTEVFVFVSGYTCMLAYAARCESRAGDDSDTRGAARLGIYAAFLLLLIAYLALIWAVGDDRRYLDETNTGSFQRSRRAIVHAWSCNIRRSTPTYCHLRAAAFWSFRACCGADPQRVVALAHRSCSTSWCRCQLARAGMPSGDCTQSLGGRSLFVFGPGMQTRARRLRPIVQW